MILKVVFETMSILDKIVFKAKGPLFGANDIQVNRLHRKTFDFRLSDRSTFSEKPFENTTMRQTLAQFRG